MQYYEIYTRDSYTLKDSHGESESNGSLLQQEWHQKSSLTKTTALERVATGKKDLNAKKKYAHFY